MKKKIASITALCLGFSLCLGALAGCGAAGGNTADGNTTESTAENTAGNTTENAVGNTDADNSGVMTFPLPDGPEASEIYVEPIPEIADDFIRGMDASSVLAEENSGVTYYNFEGEEQDVFMTLTQSGVNYIRLRVWNDPYDENGNGYGGGNNDLATAVTLGRRATQYGMKVCIDFHYSDFWADPKRQHAPKAWEGMTAQEKYDALYAFTKDSLTELLDAGVDVGMVQIGNEINNGLAGETLSPTVMNLLVSGSRAVREVSAAYGRDILVAVHYTDIEEADKINLIALNLMNFGVDYDVFGLSYYPFWDGTRENMQAVARNIEDKYGKQVMIAETSYCYTAEDGDGTANSLSGTDDLTEGYPATVQGQASMIRDICAAAQEAGVMGIFYWEGAWIPVGSDAAANAPVWEKYGSGWASSYAADYDPDDAGLYYGGCSWDNQAMFDFTGHPLASLNVFKYLKYGATAPLAIDSIPDVYLSADVGSDVALPAQVDVIYNDRSANTQVPVTWDEAQLAAIDSDREGNYEVTGTVNDGSTVTAHIEIKLLNHVLNPSFEEADTSMWKVTYAGEQNPTDFQVKADDAYTGSTAFHFWSEASDMDFAIEQTLTGLEPGTYRLTVYAQGGDVSDDCEMALYASADGGAEQTAPFMVTGWANWQSPTLSEIKITDGTLTFGVRMKCNAKSWGTLDEFTLNRIGD